jgi:hypothetical protein
MSGPRIREPRVVQQIIVGQRCENGDQICVLLSRKRKFFDESHEVTLSLMQTFVVSFDVSVMAMWLPCALLLSRWNNQ